MVYKLDAVDEANETGAWDEVKNRVEKHGNVDTITMEALRELYGCKRLGVTVCSEISDILTGLGLGHIPKELPTYQHELVRIYKKATPIGNLIDTVLTPGAHNDYRLCKLLASRAVRHRLREAVVRAKAENV